MSSGWYKSHTDPVQAVPAWQEIQLLEQKQPVGELLGASDRPA